MNTIFDDQDDVPLRQVIGSLISRATHADVAVARINAGALDLGRSELATVRCGRILLGRLDARSVSDAGPLEPLLELVRERRLFLRSSGMCSWSPDFSCFRGPGLHAGLVGAHYFRTPVAESGPSFTCLVTDPAAVARLTQRFEQMWDRAYDVGDAVLDLVRRTSASS